jgi:hypothetical protein
MAAGCMLPVEGTVRSELTDPYKHWDLGLGRPAAGMESRIAEEGREVAGHAGSLRCLEGRMMEPEEPHHRLAGEEESMGLSFDTAKAGHMNLAAGCRTEAGHIEAAEGGSWTGCTVQQEDTGCCPKGPT